MEKPVSLLIRSALAGGIAEAAARPVTEREIRLPARGADAAWPGAIRLGLDPKTLAKKLNAGPSRFTPLFGIPPVGSVTEKNGWLLFTLNKALFDAALTADVRPLPPERPDDGELRLKLFMLARHDPQNIPDAPDLRRAILMLWALEESPSRARAEKAVSALLEAPGAVPPMERPAYTKRLGAPARLALATGFGPGTIE